MAIFNKNEELARQQVRIAPEQAKGLKKAALAGLGYKATGEQSGFGKVLGYIPGGQTTRHFMARAVAGKADKSDYAKTLKAGDKDALNKGIQDLKFGLEAGKFAATMGAGTGAGKIGGAVSKMTGADAFSKLQGKAEGKIMDKLGEQALNGISMEETSEVADSPLVSGGGISGGISGEDALKQFQESGGDMESLDKFNQVKESQKGNKLIEGKGILDSVIDKSFNAAEENLQTNPTEGGKYDKAINTTDKIGDLGSNVPIVGGLIEAGAGSAAAGMSYNAALAEKNKEFQNKKKALSDDSLWM